MIVKVIVNVASSNVDYLYDYLVSAEDAPYVKIGSRVKVPFGQADRLIMGYILEIAGTSDLNIPLKEIVELVDLDPFITIEQINLAKIIQKETICPLVRILNLMIPEALHLITSKYFEIINYDELDADLALALGRKQIVKYTNKFSPLLGKINREIKKGNLQIRYEASPRASTRIAKKYTLNNSQLFQSVPFLKSVDLEILETLQNDEPLTKIEMVEKTGISLARITRFIKKGFFTEHLVPVSRIKSREIVLHRHLTKDFKAYDDTVTRVNELKAEKSILLIARNQLESLSVISNQIRNNMVNEKKTIIICPDILTSFLYRSLITQYLHYEPSIINSQLPSVEILDTFLSIRNNECFVVVTTSKGAMFDFGPVGSYIMINTESDNYYSDQSPRYNLKRVVELYANLINASYIMHTYSPNIGEYIRGVQGNYHIIDNREDFPNKDVEIVDLRQEELNSAGFTISTKLIKQLKTLPNTNQQALLIINNKGYSSFMICRTCGEVLKCPACDISLTYIKNKEQLVCPSCSYRIKYHNTCPRCNGKHLQMLGMGMERLEEEIKAIDSNLRVIKVDNSNYDDYLVKMAQIEEKEIDIIIATDVFARSIVTNDLQLVAIVSFDTILKTPNYEANQQAYNMLIHTLEHLRNNPNTKMYIQTYIPDHFVIKAFILDNYRLFFKEEVEIRKYLKNEPFYHINRILVKGGYNEMFVEANRIKKTLKELLNKDVFIIGPTYNRRYQAVQIIVKHKMDTIHEYYFKIYQQYQQTTLTIIFDMYPKYL